MNRRRLSRSGIELTELGFGGAPLGGLYTAVESAGAHAALAAAWDAGIRYFDTAPLYGGGLSEQLFGAFLRGKPRAEFVISTKVGRSLRPAVTDVARSGNKATFVGGLPNDAEFDFSAAAVERSIGESLERLGLGRIDLLYIHDPDEHLEQAVQETYPALAALRAAGAVRAIGAGMNNAAPLAEMVRRCDFDVVMLAGRYTVLDRIGSEALLSACARRDVPVVAGGIFNSGITSTASPQPGAPFDYLPASAEMIARVRRMADICAHFGTDLPTAALRFPSQNSGIAATVVGMRSAAEVALNIARAQAVLPAALWRELDREALY